MSFKKAQAKIQKESGVSEEAAGAILASASRKASPEAKKKNPKLSKVKGVANMKSNSKDFKPHKMFGSGGVVKFVKTMKEHLALKEKGYGHTKKK
jgi:hypothetical protein